MQAQSDGEYKFILVYQDHLTKYVLLRPLKHKRAENVAYVLLDIFTTFGAPSILQSDNGREFANKVVTEICAMWPELKIVHGKPRHSQSQGSVERANQDIENMLATWLTDNRTKKWSEGFGTKAKIGLKSTLLPINIISDLRTEEDLDTALNSISTTSNSNNDIENTEAVPLRIKSICESRNESLKNLKVQATKMKQASENRFRPGEVGQSVTVKIPDVDRARSDFRNIIGVILSINNDMYEIGTKEDRLSTLYSRNQFLICKERFLKADDVPQTMISLRETVRKFSNLGGQGYDQFNTTPNFFLSMLRDFSLNSNLTHPLLKPT
ncbi:hypothetical protein QTP88_025471 [Uroleucon formosanum]